MNEQIEQLERDLHKASALTSVTIEGRYDVLARFLYENEYRKQSEVVREIFEEIEKLMKKNALNGVSSFLYDFAELKKKRCTEVRND